MGPVKRWTHGARGELWNPGGVYLMRIGAPGAEKPVARVDDDGYVDLSDVVKELEKKYGPAIPSARETAMVKGVWRAVPQYRGFFVAAFEGQVACFGVAVCFSVTMHYRSSGGMMGEAQLRAGRPQDALACLAGGLRQAEENGERLHDPELHRLTGEIHFLLGDSAAGERSLRRAIKIAQSQQAKMPELRAALSLARVWSKEKRAQDARALLEPLDAWFMEGRDTPELLEMRAILDRPPYGATHSPGLQAHAG